MKIVIKTDQPGNDIEEVKAYIALVAAAPHLLRIFRGLMFQVRTVVKYGYNADNLDDLKAHLEDIYTEAHTEAYRDIPELDDL